MTQSNGIDASVAHPARVWDFLLGILLYVQDSEDPWGIVRRIMDAVPVGSYLAITHGASDIDPSAVEASRQFNQRAVVPMTLRPQAEIARFFEGLDLLGPGVVPLDAWDLNQAQPRPGKLPAYGGLGRKN
jgi:hypothetical protein